ncbi:MAG: spermidine synthase [Burkholderiales bacterium]|nr:spermidine synthase [Burkholderiales bacterium]MBH2016966.1 spermidine synthase [Burkholderiales bacterium]
MTDLPRLHQNSQTVTLSFEGTLIQSCMRLDDPDDLVLDYTRTMMGALLFNPRPARVLMIGLGGGSLVKYLHRHVPEADVTVVEISQSVIDLRDAFHVPPDDARLHTVCADGAKFMAHPPHAYDLILVDGFTGEGIAEALCSRSFYLNCRKALTPEGLLVANVQADTEQTREIGKRLFKAFGGSMISVLSDEGGNDIVTAGPRHLFEQGRADFEGHWAALSAAHQATLGVTSSRIQRALIKGFPIG